MAVLASRLAAQNLLYIDHEGKLALVRRADGVTACVMEDGKLTQALGENFVLQPAPEYLPVMVSVKNLVFKRHAGSLPNSAPMRVHGGLNVPGESNTLPATARAEPSVTGTVGNGGRINNWFLFNADFESAYGLDDVFIVLAMKTQKEGNMLYLRGLGRLDANRVSNIAFTAKMPFPFGGTRMTLHVFAGGQEVFNSSIPAAEQAAALDRMVANRISSLQDSELKPLFGPPPNYPDSLVKTHAKGRAEVSFRVDEGGAVIDPKVASASDPAFGEAALAAIRQWRFLPRVKGGRPIEATASLPFVFTPPS